MPSTTIYANKGARIATSGGTSLGAGASDYLPVGLYSGYLYRSLLGFSYSFTGWTSITSAILNVRTSTQFYVAFGSDPDIWVRRLTSSWSEGSSVGLSGSNAVEWSNQPSATSSNQGSADIPTTESDWYTIDITALMQDALAAGVFYGLLLLSQEEGTEQPTEFYSDDTTSEPYISITYSTNTPPNAPTDLTPTGDEVKHTLTPTFGGAPSDDDAGDSMTGVQIQVFEDDATTLKWNPGMKSTFGLRFSEGYTGPSLTGNTFYRWRARTKDAAGATGAWSAKQRFKVNSLPTAPTCSISGSSSDLTDLTPNLFVTHNDPDASDQNMLAYQVVVTKTSDGSTVWDTGTVSVSARHTLTLTYAGPALSWGTAYTFKARTKDSNEGWSPFSSSFAFTTHAAQTPIGLDPTGSDSSSSLTPTLVGSRGSGSDVLTNFEIELYEDDGTTLKWSSGSLATGSTTGFSKVYNGPALSQVTGYKWRARITSSVGGVSPWSALQRFVTPDVSVPTGTSPLGPGITDLTPDLTFDRASSFNMHELTVYAADGTTVLWTDSPASYGATTSKAVTYAGTALVYGTTYKWKVRVSSDGGSSWSPYTGLMSFTTDKAGVPTLTAPVSDSWETTLTPTFEGTTAGGEVISTYRIILYADDQSTEVWDSGDIAGSGTSFSKVYDGGTALVPGSRYYWKASYVKSGSIPGDYSPLEGLHINASPSTPTGLSPAPGSTVADTLTPTFYATYEDSDISLWGDTPTLLEVEVYRVSDDVLMHSLSNGTALEVGQNSVARTSEGTALSYEVEYSFRARYTDSKSEVGTWSQLQVFKPSQSPAVAITAPVSTIGSPSFDVEWTLTSPGGKSQSKYRVVVERTSDEVVMYDSGEVTSSALVWTMPPGYLVNGTGYSIFVYSWDSDGLVAYDSVLTTQPYSVSAITSDWTAPPAPASFSAATDPATSAVILTWEASTLTDEEFSYYQVYRREVGDQTWEPYAVETNKSTTSYTDLYAANNVIYDYKVTQFQIVPGDVDLESEEESVASALLDVDEWFVIGADRSADHSFSLPVTAEGHQKPVQQEVFEPLGSRRKKTARGNVLGHEGTFDLTYDKAEREDAKRRLLYLADAAGPHILKSPFEDVWLVEFAGPSIRYAPGGHMMVTLAWVEVA